MSNEKSAGNQPLYPRLDTQSSPQPPAYTPPPNNKPNNNLPINNGQQYGQQYNGQQAHYVVLPPPQDLLTVGDQPAVVVCPHCNQGVLTVTNYRTGPATFASAAGLFVFGTGPLALAPFFINAAKDVVHTCPNCHRLILKKKRLGGRKIYTSNGVYEHK